MIVPRVPIILVIFLITQLLAVEADAKWRAREPRRGFHFHVSAGAGSEEAPPPKKRTASLVDQGPGHVGGFGGVGVGYAPLVGGNGLVIGGEGAILLGHRFSIGAAGYGLVNDISRSTPDGARDRIGLGYGGVRLRYHLIHNYPVYPTMGTLVGFGGVSFDGNGGDIILVLEPEAAIFVNITKWIRIGLSVSYTYVTGVDTPGLGNADFRAPGFMGHIDFGSF